MHLIVVGAGATTRDLLRGLGDAWDVTVVDPDPERLSQAGALRTIEAVPGEPSDPAALDQAGLGTADAFVAASSSDESNLAACRLALESRVEAVAAVAADPERVADYRELGVAAFSPDRLAARRLETALEPRRVSSTEFAEGWAEAMEFRIARDSPMQGKALQELDFADWLVVAVLRKDRLIVPHGNTILQPDDLVTVVGDAERSAEMVQAFTEGVARFPRDHGTRVAVQVRSATEVEPAVAEAVHLLRHCAADGVALLHAPDVAAGVVAERVQEMAADRTVTVHPLPKGATRVPASVAADVDAGVVVVDPPAPAGIRGRADSVRLVRYARDLGRPVLVSRATHPYRRIVVQAAASPAQLAAIGVAIDLAAIRGSRLLALSVTTPPFIAGPETPTDGRAAAMRLGEEAAVQGVAVDIETRQGNPVRVMESAAADHSLLVTGLTGRRPTFLDPGTVAHLVRRADSSMMLIPSRD